MAALDTVTALPFWDLAALWAGSTGGTAPQAAVMLARGVIFDGLLISSVEAASLDLESGSMDFRGDPFVGYRASPESPLMILRNTALRHLVAIARDGEAPRRAPLAQEVIGRRDFRAWLIMTGRELPAFWYPPGGCR